jgi:glutamyl-Q tRNA(Asp) synthetase
MRGRSGRYPSRRRADFEVTAYRGRFAPSPTGPLHAGSLAAALASWLDARAAGGTWLVRIEDLDPPREVPDAARHILEALACFGMESDEPVLFQSQRGDFYEVAFARLQDAGRVYACSCSRSDIERAIAALPGWPAGIYPGTCAGGRTMTRPLQAWRIRAPDDVVGFIDRAVGRYEQRLARDVGDFVVRRADGLWAYQLAVVVDDAAQRISDIVRGADLLDNTPRQIFLQRVLGLPTPHYLHVPVVLNAAGEKLSKQSGATALDQTQPLAELERAAQHLGLTIGAVSVGAFLHAATEAWRERWPSKT